MCSDAASSAKRLASAWQHSTATGPHSTPDGLVPPQPTALLGHEGLRDATDRDVSIQLAGLSDDVDDRIREKVPDAGSFETVWAWTDAPAGRILLVDGEHALASVFVDGDDESPTEYDRDLGEGAVDRTLEETAIWGSGRRNSLVVVLDGVFTWRLGNSDAE